MKHEEGAKKTTNMGHKQDWWEDLRLWLIPKLGRIAQHLSEKTDENIYTSYEIHNNQFVGRVDIPEEEFEEKLDDMGFERNPIAALKVLSSTNEIEEGSWRKIYPDEHPDMQLHVMLFDGSAINNAPTGCVYIYAHWELRWDKYPFAHYRGEQLSGAKGVQKMKNMLDAEGIVYTLERPPAT